MLPTLPASSVHSFVEPQSGQDMFSGRPRRRFFRLFPYFSPQQSAPGAIQSRKVLRHFPPEHAKAIRRQRVFLSFHHFTGFYQYRPPVTQMVSLQT